MNTEEYLAHETEWTVRDDDGVDHRAVRQHIGWSTFVVTACPWWKTHNVAGQKATLRIDRTPTCIECTMIELSKIGAPS